MFTVNSEEKEVARLSKLSEIEAQRESLVEQLRDYASRVKGLCDAYRTMNLYASDIGKKTCFYDGTVDTNTLLEEVDRRLWDFAISSSGVARILSSEGEAELRKRYQEHPAPFSAAEAERVLARLAENTDLIALSTVRRVFEQLVATTFRRGHSWRSPAEKRSHDRIRKSFRFSHFYGVRHMHDDRVAIFNDLELVCRMLQHQPKLERPNRIGDQMYAESWQGFNLPAPWKYTNPYFEVTLFKNGNVKIDFLCEKTLELLNRYGSDGRSLVEPFVDLKKSS